MSYERLSLEDDGSGTVSVILARPDRHNAVDMKMLREMPDMQRHVRANRHIRGIVLRGEGPSFCSGLDFKAVTSSKANLIRAALELYSPRRNLFQRWSMGWRDVPVPVIAALHGHCYGAGLQLALGADIRLAAPDTKLSFMEARFGLVPDMGGPTLLRELMPIDRAKELVFSGRVLDAAEALELGLITGIHPDPAKAAATQLASWSARSPDALAAGKFMLQEAWSASEGGSIAARNGEAGSDSAYQHRAIGG